MIRLSKAARVLNVGKDSIVEYLSSIGIKVENSPNAKLSDEHLQLLGSVAKKYFVIFPSKPSTFSIVTECLNSNVIISKDPEVARWGSLVYLQIKPA